MRSLTSPSIIKPLLLHTLYGIYVHIRRPCRVKRTGTGRWHRCHRCRRWPSLWFVVDWWWWYYRGLTPGWHTSVAPDVARDAPTVAPPPGSSPLSSANSRSSLFHLTRCPPLQALPSSLLFSSASSSSSSSSLLLLTQSHSFFPGFRLLSFISTRLSLFIGQLHSFEQKTINQHFQYPTATISRSINNQSRTLSTLSRRRLASQSKHSSGWSNCDDFLSYFQIKLSFSRIFHSTGDNSQSRQSTTTFDKLVQ